MSDVLILKQLASLIRSYILESTTAAGSGHPTSSLSATDLMTVLMFGGYFKADLNNPHNSANDRLIFSKGHASPLFYSLYTAAGAITKDELLTLRQFNSRLEGHPTMQLPYTEAATGSLGQGLSVGVGMALQAKLDEQDYQTFVLLGDSEMAEGSVWEAMQVASHYQLNNLIGIIDVNRLGQRGETMLGWDTENYRHKCEAFGWETCEIDGHDFVEIIQAFDNVTSSPDTKPKMIIAKTVKGKGVSFLENQENWHGKALKQEELERALSELGAIEKVTGVVGRPTSVVAGGAESRPQTIVPTEYALGEDVAPRKAYGKALASLGSVNKNVVVLDAETSNSTFASLFKDVYTERFFEMFIAEQNMVGVALGLSKRGKIPFVSTFSAFFSRAFDQIRMSQYSDSHIIFAGSHVGVSIGEDGSSQMGLEDLAMFRSVQNMTVLYPSDAVATEKLVDLAATLDGNVYLRLTRAETPVIYSMEEEFTPGGSKTLRSSDNDVVTVFAAGITLFEALKAYDILARDNIFIRVIDMYSVKPLDREAILQASMQTEALLVAEDHYPEGGLYEAICASGSVLKPCYSLAVRKPPRSGKPEELLAFEEIDYTAIVRQVRSILLKK